MNTDDVHVFHSNAGARVYRLPLDLFPGLKGYAHLVFAGDVTALVDVGSGFGDSNTQLEARLAEVGSSFGEHADWQDITHILITHGHVDHFGGLHFVRQRTSAPIGVHELDLRVLAHYEQRLDIVAHRLRTYLIEAGVPSERLGEIMALYLLNKQLFRSIRPDFTFGSQGLEVGRLKMIHVPGHCPGQVVIQVDDLLLTADHILAETSPHQSPERLCFHTGLAHFLESLAKIRPMARDVTLALGGHEGPIYDLPSRIAGIQDLHRKRLGRVLAILQAPRTIAQVAAELFPGPEGYHKLLALEEAGAHVEYLENYGFIGIVNVTDLESDSVVPLCYQRRRVPEWFDLERGALDADQVVIRLGASKTL